MTTTAILAPPTWEGLLALLEPGTVLVVGAGGTGKSCLARYLVSQFDRSLGRVALVDSDVGQTAVGTPGCLGLALTGPWRAPAALWFVGDVAPSRRATLPMVVGTGRLVERARAAGARTVIINTCGWVEGVAGRELKLHQALAAGVDQVVALERGDELGPLVDLLGRSVPEVHRVAASARARERTPDERCGYRTRRLRAHFVGAQRRWFGRTKLVGPDWSPGGATPTRGTLVGLLGADGFCLALGAVREVGGDRVSVLTPWRGSGAVARVQVGHLSLDGALLAEIDDAAPD